MELFKKNKNRKNFTSKGAFNLISVFWKKSYTYIYSVFFLAVILFGIYIWYQSFYSGQWSDDKKQQYLNSQEKGVVFKENMFRNSLDDIEARKNDFNKEYSFLKDVFTPYPGAITEVVQ